MTEFRRSESRMHPTRLFRQLELSELQQAPEKVFAQARLEPIEVVDQDKTAGFIFSPQLMACLLDALIDDTLASKSSMRAASLTTARKISLNDL